MKLRGLAVVLLIGLLAGPALAVDGMSVESGFGKDSRMARVGVQWWSDRQWHQRDDAHVGAYWELTLGAWRRNWVYPGQDIELTEIGLTPVFRWQRNNKRGWYAEGGVGAHLLSGTTLGFRQFSTGFQFGSLLGVGYRFGPHGAYDLGMRVQHLSNADIKRPNDGMNFTEVRLQYWF